MKNIFHSRFPDVERIIVKNKTEKLPEWVKNCFRLTSLQVPCKTGLSVEKTKKNDNWATSYVCMCECKYEYINSISQIHFNPIGKNMNFMLKERTIIDCVEVYNV